MKKQASFSSKDKCKKLKCRLLQFLFGALRVRIPKNYYSDYTKIEQFGFYNAVMHLKDTYGYK